MTSTEATEGLPVELADMFDELGDQPFVSYPPLTRDELLALGDAPLLNDTDDVAWWASLAEPTRRELLATAQRGLLARGLVSIDAVDAEQLDISAPLRVILALRRAPAFVTLVGNARRPSPVLRCYGVLGPGGRVAVLVEARLITGVAEYLICAPSYAATTAARLLLAAPDSTDADAVGGPAELGGRVVRRRLEIFPPGSLDGGRRYLAYAGTTSGALAAVDASGQAGPAHEVAEQSVADLIVGYWAADVEPPADGGQ